MRRGATARFQLDARFVRAEQTRAAGAATTPVEVDREGESEGPQAGANESPCNPRVDGLEVGQGALVRDASSAEVRSARVRIPRDAVEVLGPLEVGLELGVVDRPSRQPVGQPRAVALAGREVRGRGTHHHGAEERGASAREAAHDGSHGPSVDRGRWVLGGDATLEHRALVLQHGGIDDRAAALHEQHAPTAGGELAGEGAAAGTTSDHDRVEVQDRLPSAAGPGAGLRRARGKGRPLP